MATTPGDEWPKIRPLNDEGADRCQLIGPGSFVRHKNGGPVGIVLEVRESEDLLIFWIVAGRMFSIEPEAWFRRI